jgi:uncharacterized protein YifE (UPF0438 family)
MLTIDIEIIESEMPGYLLPEEKSLACEYKSDVESLFSASGKEHTEKQRRLIRVLQGETAPSTRFEHLFRRVTIISRHLRRLHRVNEILREKQRRDRERLSRASNPHPVSVPAKPDPTEATKEPSQIAKIQQQLLSIEIIEKQQRDTIASLETELISKRVERAALELSLKHAWRHLLLSSPEYTPPEEGKAEWRALIARDLKAQQEVKISALLDSNKNLNSEDVKLIIEIGLNQLTAKQIERLKRIVDEMEIDTESKQLVDAAHKNTEYLRRSGPWQGIIYSSH